MGGIRFREGKPPFPNGPSAFTNAPRQNALICESVMKAAWIICFALTLAQPALAQEPSFDCVQATSPDELAICDSPVLATLEAKGAQAFAQVSIDHEAVAKAIARPALQARRECGADAACIEDVLMQALYSYWTAGARSDQADEMDWLIADWAEANLTCRESIDPEVGLEACSARNLLTVQLHDIGLCEGAYLLDLPDFATATLLRERWVPCFYPELQK